MSLAGAPGCPRSVTVGRGCNHGRHSPGPQLRLQEAACRCTCGAGSRPPGQLPGPGGRPLRLPVTPARPLDLSGPPAPTSATGSLTAPGPQVRREEEVRGPTLGLRSGLSGTAFIAVEPLGFHETQFGKRCPSTGFSAKRGGGGPPSGGRGPTSRGLAGPAPGSRVGRAGAGFSCSVDGLRRQAAASSALGPSWGPRGKGPGHRPASSSGLHPTAGSPLRAGPTPWRGVSPRPLQRARWPGRRPRWPLLRAVPRGPRGPTPALASVWPWVW